MKSLLRWLKCLLVEESSITGQISKFRFKPRRWLIVTIAFSLFIVWNGFQDSLTSAYEPFTKIATEGKVSGLKVEVSLKTYLAALWSLIPVICKGALCVLLGWAITKALLPAIDEHLKKPKEVANIIELLLEQSGIAQVYHTKNHVPIAAQPYADAVRLEAHRSKSFRLLTIAGYEYFGRGAESLLYDVLSNKPQLDFEAVIVDSAKGSAVIKERVAQLHGRDTTITEEKIKNHINSTKALFNELKKAKTDARRIELRVTNRHPIFRLLILDHCLFLSTYTNDCHGHESPVYKINKTKHVSWYASFEKYYEQSKELAKLAA